VLAQQQRAALPFLAQLHQRALQVGWGYDTSSLHASLHSHQLPIGVLLLKCLQDIRHAAAHMPSTMPDRLLTSSCRQRWCLLNVQHGHCHSVIVRASNKLHIVPATACTLYIQSVMLVLG
jgi:hypothetical protein